MATDIVIPNLGESISEAVIASWLKADGEYVNDGDEIVELETDKVTMPLPSPGSGVLTHGAGEGDTVAVGASVGRLDESAEKPAKASAETSKAGAAKPAASRGGSSGAAAKRDSGTDPAETSGAPARKPAARRPVDVSGGVDREEAMPAAGARGHAPAPAAGAGAARLTPVARKLADEHGVDASHIVGTGPGGRIRERDVLAFIQTRGAASNGAANAVAASAPAAASPDREPRRERMSQLRQRIASRLVEAQHTAAMLTTFNECDMTAVMSLRSAHKESFERAHGVKLGFMSFFVAAACSALRAFPLVNASIVDGGSGPEIEHRGACHVAIAVGTPKGLVVPVLRDADTLSFAEIEAGIGELAARARDGKLTLDDMTGGTFTISNGGVYGSMMSTPILNPPQSGILGMHNIIRRPVEHPDKPGSGEVVVRPMMYLALSYDHRIVDGEGAVRFLRHVKDRVESPQRLLLDA